jgi:hypothetical protein
MMDKSAFSVASLRDEVDDRAYWQKSHHRAFGSRWNRCGGSSMGTTLPPDFKDF